MPLITAHTPWPKHTWQEWGSYDVLLRITDRLIRTGALVTSYRDRDNRAMTVAYLPATGTFEIHTLR